MTPPAPQPAPAPQPTPPGLRTVQVTLTVAGRPLNVRVDVPTAPIPPAELLPFYRALVDSLVKASTKLGAGAGRSVSCRQGCAHCCRQLVPVSALEARELMKRVEQMPEPLRSRVKARFVEARRRLEAEAPELMSRMLYPNDYPGEPPAPIAHAYYRLRIDCPFLENEACTIHAERPVACRQIVVSSPPEHCAELSPQVRPFDVVGGPAFPWMPAVERTPGGRFVEYLALVLAPEFLEKHPEEPAPRAGTEWLSEFLARMQQRGTWSNPGARPAPAGPAPAAASAPPPRS